MIKLKIIDDFKMIVHKLPEDLEYVNIYPIGDLHVGSAEFNLELWKRWKHMVMNDPNGYIVIVGDMMNCAFKNSKSNVYEDVLSPYQQKEWLVENLYDLREKILGMCAGNHIQRATRELGYHPMFDVAKELGIPEVYRENLFFTKINFGKRNKTRQYSYCLCGHHGGSRNKREKFQLSIDNIDAMITGHTHCPEYSAPTKICVDVHNETVTTKSFRSIVVNSFLKYGGYGVEKMYLPQEADSIQYFTLTKNKKIELHWI